MTFRSSALAVLAFVPSLVVLTAGALLPSLRSVPTMAQADPEGIDGLRRELTFRRAILEAARNDGMTLLVDPAAGTLELRHGAVVLRRVETSGLRVDARIRFAHPDSAVVGRVRTRYGLIPPEPVRHVAAPADTAEANRMPTDIPVEDEPSVVTIVCEPDLVIRLTPNDIGGYDRAAGILFRTFERFSVNLGDLARGRAPAGIAARASDADVRAVYRALSEGSSVVVRTGVSDSSSR